MKYGLSYQGAKGSFAKELIKYFPSNENFFDVFGGGFAITHAMILHRPRHFKSFHFNEIRPGVCDLIKGAINGDYAYTETFPKWISREEFFAKKDSNSYVRFVWSFGNNGRNYLFGKKIERYKKSLHNAVVFNDFDEIASDILGVPEFPGNTTIKERRLFVRNRVKSANPDKEPTELQHLQQLQQLERLQQLQRLERLQQPQQLRFYQSPYEKLDIPRNTTVYCDPPYRETGGYDGQFDSDRFLGWASKIDNPVFISEYNIKHKDFFMIYSKKVPQKFSPQGQAKKATEKLYCNRQALKMLKR